MSNKYKHGKYRLSVAGDNKTQNKPIIITDDEGNDALLSKNGVYPDLIAGNLDSWAGQDSLSVNDVWMDAIRTTAGETPIVTESGGKLVSILPQTDFYAQYFKTTGYNQLSQAVAVGDGWYFPVPKLTFGVFGTAQENNGILFTDKNGVNQTPTVYFKAFGSGVPSSVTDGTKLESVASKDTANASGGIYTEQGFGFYVTPSAGYLIVSGIDRNELCAHVAWEDWYDKYVPITADGEQGSSINIGALIHMMHTYDRMLVYRSGANFVCDRMEFGDDKVTLYPVLDKISINAYSGSTPKWTDTANPVGEDEPQTYTHSATISAMKSNGVARVGDIILTVSGTTVSYVDTNEHAPAAEVVYEKATVTPIEVAYTNTEVFGEDFNGIYALNDCGFEILTDVVGTAYVTTLYAQNFPDKLAEMARYDIDELTEIIAESLTELHYEVESLRSALKETRRQLDYHKAHAVMLPNVVEVNAVSASAPASAAKGYRYINSTDLKIYTATADNTFDDGADPGTSVYYKAGSTYYKYTAASGSGSSATPASLTTVAALAPLVQPEFIGQFYMDWLGGKSYQAKNNSAVAGFVLLN